MNAGSLGFDMSRIDKAVREVYKRYWLEGLCFLKGLAIVILNGLNTLKSCNDVRCVLHVHDPECVKILGNKELGALAARIKNIVNLYVGRNAVVGEASEYWKLRLSIAEACEILNLVDSIMSSERSHFKLAKTLASIARELGYVAKETFPT